MLSFIFVLIKKINIREKSVILVKSKQEIKGKCFKALLDANFIRNIITNISKLSNANILHW